ncbi:Ig-like domain-containing protein [Candidatus Microgenomates bacterium]|nr:Ig-like domain-containing protein [Candidatus Microgenomates bacterium]
MTRPAQCIAVLILLFIIGSLSYIIFLTPEPVQIFASHVPGHEGGGGSDPDPPEGDCGTGSSCSTGCSSGVCKDQDEPPANPPPGACDGSGNCKWTDPDSPWCSGGCCTGSSCPDDSGDDGGGGGGGGGGSSPTPSPTPAPAPTCTIDLVPASSTVIIDSSTPLVASFSASSGTINEVHFSSSDTGNVTVSPAADSDSPYGITASGASLGSATITATVHMTTTGHDHETACSDTATVEVTNPPGWWQTKDADVWSRGDLVSNIPSTYDGNGCDGRWFSCTGAGGYPGVLVYNGDVNFNWGGIGSSKGWLAESGYAGPSYSYSWFESKIHISNEQEI